MLSLASIDSQKHLLWIISSYFKELWRWTKNFAENKKEYAERNKLLSRTTKLPISCSTLGITPIIRPLLLFYVKKGAIARDVSPTCPATHSPTLLWIVCSELCWRMPWKRSKQQNFNFRCWNDDFDWEQFIWLSEQGPQSKYEKNMWKVFSR